MTNEKFHQLVEEVADRLGVRAEWLDDDSANIGEIELRHGKSCCLYANKLDARYPIPYIARDGASGLVASAKSYRSSYGVPTRLLPPDANVLGFNV